VNPLIRRVNPLIRRVNPLRRGGGPPSLGHLAGVVAAPLELGALLLLNGQNLGRLVAHALVGSLEVTAEFLKGQLGGMVMIKDTYIYNTYIHTYTHIYISVYIYICIYIGICIYIYIYIHPYISYIYII